MNLGKVYQEIEIFSKEPGQSLADFKERIFVRGKERDQFAPFKFLTEKIDGLERERELYKEGFCCNSYDLYEQDNFSKWYERHFSQKLKRAHSKKINIFYRPEDKAIFDSIELINKSYEILREQRILTNNKNFPTQLGEWYVRSIFGLKQIKSTSQRGFDFFLEDQRVEIRVEWGDKSSPKGVKIRKSLLALSSACILIYIARNFTIREICFLDSDFIMRKFQGKGHTIFLKDSDISQYFFSISNKHLDKAINHNLLMRYATSQFAIKLSESFK